LHIVHDVAHIYSHYIAFEFSDNFQQTPVECNFDHQCDNKVCSACTCIWIMPGLAQITTYQYRKQHRTRILFSCKHDWRHTRAGAWSLQKTNYCLDI